MTLKLTVMLGPTSQIEAAELAMPDPDGCLFAAAALEDWQASAVTAALDGFKEMFATSIRNNLHQRKGPPVELPPAPTVTVLPPAGDRVMEIARAIDPAAWSEVDASLEAARRVVALMGQT